MTGRTRWSADNGPAAFAGRHHLELLCDLLFRPETLYDQTLIRLDRRPLKESVGLDIERRFFTPRELLECKPLFEIAQSFQARKQRDNKLHPSPDEKAALNCLHSLDLFMSFANGRPLAIAPVPGQDALADVGPGQQHPGAELVQRAYDTLRGAYRAGDDLAVPIAGLKGAIAESGGMDESTVSRVTFEVLYNNHNPWKMAAYATVLALLAMLGAWLTHLRVLYIPAALFIVWAVGEQIAGLVMRVMILGRAPVSNTYEALLWMGLVAVTVGIVAQLLNRKSWYLAGGLVAALASILFAMLVPLEDQTNAMPAVLRSNYWLIVHVLTIVASYGALLLAAVLGHVYLIHDVLLRRDAGEGKARLIVQIYRVLQIGLILLTAGTILGGVWAADSWGRFWGWDPKETWSLISIIIYFTVLHARYVGWIRDFGLAVAAIAGFLAIVWTFYGVNYVMATGLHSYGFGNGGERWVFAWAVAEFVFIGLCVWRRPKIEETGDRPSRKGNTALAHQ